MTKNYILFIDSGLGGLTTLAETISTSPNNFIYFADNLHAPYGNKSTKFLKSRLVHIVDKFSKIYPLSMVVLACNTATTNTISCLRSKFPNLTFVGTEPAVALALKFNYKSSLTIATPQTINRLKNNKNAQTTLLKLPDLAKDIEHFMLFNDFLSKFKIYKTIFKLKKLLIKKDCLILGCTHYPLIKTALKKIINIPILDGNGGVAQRINSLSLQKQDFSSVNIILSLQNCKLKEKYKKILKQILANQINLC